MSHNSPPSPPQQSPPQKEEQYCFNVPTLPYLKAVQHQPPPYCITATAEHVDTATKICSAYAQREHKVCKDNYKGHAVMCPTEKFYISSCLYQWAQLGMNSEKEKSFIKNNVAPDKIDNFFNSSLKK